MLYNLFIIVSVSYLLITPYYELKLREEAKIHNKSIKGLSYFTFGLVAKPMLNIMLLKPRHISKNLIKLAIFYASIHYLLIILFALTILQF